MSQNNFTIRRIVVDAKHPKLEPLPVTRAEVAIPSDHLTPKQARRAERRAARQRIATPAPPPTPVPKRATYPGGATKSEWEHAQANVDGGSARRSR